MTSFAGRFAWAQARQLGELLLAEGRVAAMVVAGGQGSRLGFSHAKGMFPIGPVSDAPLYRLLAEQVLARSRRARWPIPYYLMTSDETHEETAGFFDEHACFGLQAAEVQLFRQGNRPAVDVATGRILLADKHLVCAVPDGHGGLAEAMAREGVLDDLKRRGVDYVFYHQVDNPTAIVCDPAFVGFHVLHRSEVSTKVVAKRSAEEKMGVVVSLDGCTQVIEYSDLPADVASRTDEAGRLQLWAGNMAVHMFDIDFLERLAREADSLPFHVAHRKMPFLNDAGEREFPAEPNAWKFERFIFDALPLARRALVVEADRRREFNPVKNSTGNDTPETARAALCRLSADWLHAAGARLAADAAVEISPLFALDADELRRKIAPGTRVAGRAYLGP